MPPMGKETVVALRPKQVSVCGNASNQNGVFRVMMSLKSLMVYSSGEKKVDRWNLFKVQRRGEAVYSQWNVVFYSHCEFLLYLVS